MDREFYDYWIGTLPGIGLKRMARWREYMGDFAGLYDKGAELLREKGLCTEREWELLTNEPKKRQAQKEWEELKAKSITYCSYYNEQLYPKRLRQLHRPPKHLYVKGKMPEQSRIAVGIVGARECTPYGRDMARMFGYRLAEAGVNVISGMARGIDGWAHQGALESGGETFAVLGCGVDICYPAEHRRLYDSMVKYGGILSEFPIQMKAQKNFFPLRNRIISGLSDGILIVEAKERSGSLITADAALEQGKDVFAVPGRIGDVLSEGCNRLICQGAVPVLSPYDILEYYGIQSYINNEETVSDETEIMELLGAAPVSIGALRQHTHRDMAELLRCLSGMKKRGMIREVSRNYFVKCQ